MSFIGQTSQFDEGVPNCRLVNVTCDPSVYIGAAVRVDTGVAYNALADNLLNSNVIGIVEEKANATTCTIRFLGLTVDSIFVGLDEESEYYLSEITPGLITKIPPVAPGSVIVKVGQPFSPTQFLVLKGTRTQRL